MKKNFLLILFSVLTALGGSAQEGNIAGIQVDVIEPVDDSLELTDPIVINTFKVTIEAITLAGTQAVCICAGSQVGGEEGFSEIYQVEVHQGKYLLKNATGYYVAQLIGTKIYLTYEAAFATMENYRFWEVWEKYPDNSLGPKYRFEL